MFKTNNPLVSVILPCYNVERFVSKAIISILKQTYTNIEIIAINDGSTDETFKVLNELKNKFDNLNIFNSENKGYGATVQYGFNIAKGKYICILEPDDFWDNFYIEPLVNEAEGSAADAVFYNSYFEVRNNFKKTLINQYFHGRFVGDFRLNLNEIKSRLLSGAVGICFGLYNKHFLLKNKIKMDENSKAYEDVSFIAKVFAKSRNINLICGGGYHYKRDVPNQSVVNYKKFESILSVVDNFYKTTTLSNDILPAINGYFVKHLITYFWKSNQYGLSELQNLIIKKIEQIGKNGEILVSKSIEIFLKSRCNYRFKTNIFEPNSIYSKIPSLAEAIKSNRLISFLSFSKWKLYSFIHNNSSINSILCDIYPLIATPGIEKIDAYKEFIVQLFNKNNFNDLLNTNQSIFIKLLSDATELKIINSPFSYINDYRLYSNYKEIPFVYKWKNHKNNDIDVSSFYYKRFLETNLQALKIFLENKTIAIVGNSPCELNLNKGADIDKNDIIIRFNNFIIEDRYIDDYGKKTNIWCITPTFESIHQRINIGNFNFILMPLANRFIPEFRFDWLKNMSQAGIPIVLFPVDSILKIYDMRVVSLGLLTILYIINNINNIKINIYGFSLTDQIYGIKHYFSGDPSSGKLLKYHDWMREALFLNKMISEGKIYYE